MGIIVDFEDFQKNRKGTQHEAAEPTLAELLGPLQTWTSDEEKCQAMQEQAERDEREFAEWMQGLPSISLE